MSDETPLECLSRLGTSGVLWAQEFNKTAVKLGYPEMDEEWLAGWFANAIENCDVIRCNPLRAENEKLRNEVMSDYHEGFEEGIKAERERCVKIAEQARDDTCDGPVAWSMADSIAAAIRGEK